MANLVYSLTSLYVLSQEPKGKKYVNFLNVCLIVSNDLECINYREIYALLVSPSTSLYDNFKEQILALDGGSTEYLGNTAVN